jgi:hypothetical protein
MEQEICFNCLIQKKLGALPCKHRAEIDILTMAADSPQIKIVSCPHKETSKEKRYKISVLVDATSKDNALEQAKFYVNSGNVLIQEVE